jgi:hypothetical protein
MKTVSAAWVPNSSTQDIYVRFNGGGFNLDKISFTAPTGMGANLVSNSDFEILGTPADNGWNTWGSGTLAYTTARAYSGSASLAMTGRSGNAPLVWDTKAENSWQLAAGKYQVSVYATIGGVSSAQLVVQAKGVDQQYLTAVDSTTITNGNWTLLQGTFTIAKTGFAQVWVQEGWTAGNPNADLYIDHVSIRPVVASNPNLIPDGTFESGQAGGWFSWNPSNPTVTSTTAHSGTNSLMRAGMQQYGGIGRDISGLVVIGKKYQASAWVNVGSVAGAKGFVKFQTAQTCGAPNDGYPWLAGADVTPGTWQRVTGTVDLTSCTSITQLQLFVGADSGDLYVDDVELTLNP